MMDLLFARTLIVKLKKALRFVLQCFMKLEVVLFG